MESIIKYKDLNQQQIQEHLGLLAKFEESEVYLKEGDLLIPEDANRYGLKIYRVEYCFYHVGTDGEAKWPRVQCTCVYYHGKEFDAEDERNQMGKPVDIMFDTVKKNYLVVTQPLEEFLADINGIVAGTKTGIEEFQPTEDSTDLISFDASSARQKVKLATLQTHSLKAKVTAVDGIATDKINAIKNMMYGKAAAMKKMLKPLLRQVDQLNAVIVAMEVYLGLDEDIVQLAKGENAPDTEPLQFVQEVYHMNVECADPYADIDYTNISKFNNWLLEHNDHFGCKNYEVTFPYQKCVGVFKIRDREKDYGDDGLVNAILNKKNQHTYIFIRNGGNLYFISNQIVIRPKLFPDRTEFLETQNNIITELRELRELQENDEVSFRESKIEKLEDKLWDSKDLQFKYKMHFLFLQGLIFRTEIFPYEKATELYLLDRDIFKDSRVKFLFEGEMKVQGTQRESFTHFLKRVNAQIKEGTRIYYCYNQWAKDRFYENYERFYRRDFYQDSYKVPANVARGIFTLEVEKDTDTYCGLRYNSGPIWHIRYVPDDYTLTTYEKRTRKERWAVVLPEVDRLGLRVELFGQDVVINYDAIEEKDLDMLEAMLWDRRNRKYYMDMVTHIKYILEARREELQREKMFIANILPLAGGSSENVSQYAMAEHFLRWWKHKVKYTRELEIDEDKATRMILPKLKKNLNNPKYFLARYGLTQEIIDNLKHASYYNESELVFYGEGGTKLGHVYSVSKDVADFMKTFIPFE